MISSESPDFGTVISALLLTCLALVILAGIVSLIFRAFISAGLIRPRSKSGSQAKNISWLPNWRSFGSQRQIKAQEKLLAEADRHIKGGVLFRALPLLRRAFAIDKTSTDLASIELASNHHQGILERLVDLSHHYDRPLLGLPVLEDLLISRTQLLRTQLELKAARASIKSRIKEKGRSTPQWATSDFDQRLSEVVDRLETNRRSLNGQIDLVFRSLEGASEPTSETTIH